MGRGALQSLWGSAVVHQGWVMILMMQMMINDMNVVSAHCLPNCSCLSVSINANIISRQSSCNGVSPFLSWFCLRTDSPQFVHVGPYIHIFIEYARQQQYSTIIKYHNCNSDYKDYAEPP